MRTLESITNDTCKDLFLVVGKTKSSLTLLNRKDEIFEAIYYRVAFALKLDNISAIQTTVKEYIIAYFKMLVPNCRVVYFDAGYNDITRESLSI
jgi:hypothetical protein